MKVTSREFNSSREVKFDWEEVASEHLPGRILFKRDLSIVKQAFEAAGYRLLYSRKKE